jgi:hypothetical protein
VSPEERATVELIDRAVRRARALLIAEALAWAAFASATTLLITSAFHLSPSATLGVVAIVAVVVSAAVGFSRRRGSQRPAVVCALERIEPSLNNLLVTANELTGGQLSASPRVRARVFGNAASVASAIDLCRALPAGRAARSGLVAAFAWLFFLSHALWGRGASSAVPQAGAPPAAAVATSPGGLRVSATIQPPAYTGLPAQTLTDPAQIEAVEGSVAHVVMGSYSTRTVLQKTGYIAIGDGDARRTIPAVVRPDALPAATITAPGRDLVYAGGNPRITFDARATDDFGLRALTLRFTKASGSGENFEFQEGEIPLNLTHDNARQWRGSASRSLSELKLQEGDMLVYRAVATDARPGDGSASSDAFFIEISKLGSTGGNAFTLPEEETRYALSQQMLIIKTERLNQRQPAMAASEVTEAALNLAVEQRMIRAQFVFMLGGEVEDEEVEAEQSTELQEGRLQNRGQRDLRAATVAMSQAEKLLTGVNLAEALKAERAAVAALQRAFARGRYILRALGSRTTLDPTRRLTGDLSSASDWRRSPRQAPVNRRAALLQDLLSGLAQLDPANAPNAASTSKAASPASPANRTSAADSSNPAIAFEQRARVLAEEALRIDAASASLRDVATELQRAADARDAVGRQRALAAAFVAAATEARRSFATAPLPAQPIDPSLAGALSDAATGGPERPAVRQNGARRLQPSGNR